MPEPGRQAFIAAATVTVAAPMGDIWAVWADVNSWKNWDDGIESTRMTGNFKAGTEFTLTPQGGEPVQVLIKEVAQGEGFSDETVLPFGTLSTLHRMEPLGDRVKITHELRADIAADAAEMFAAKIWPHMQAGVAGALGNLSDIVSTD